MPLYCLFMYSRFLCIMWFFVWLNVLRLFLWTNFLDCFMLFLKIAYLEECPPKNTIFGGCELGWASLVPPVSELHASRVSSCKSPFWTLCTNITLFVALATAPAPKKSSASQRWASWAQQQRGLVELFCMISGSSPHSSQTPSKTLLSQQTWSSKKDVEPA